MSNWSYEQRTTDAFYCLNQPSHPVPPGKIVCEVCGFLVRGAHLGIYQVQQLLGQGRSGNAYLAQHHRRQTQVVMKVFPPDRAVTNVWEVAREEALFLSRLQHPSLLPVWSCSSTQLEATVRKSYLLTVRPFVERTLARFLERMRREEATASRDVRMLVHKVIRQIGDALSFAHAQGMVHGALVPGNLLIDDQANCWIADFGLARLHLPTPPYMPPELLRISNTTSPLERPVALWNAVTPLSDQFMLAVLYQDMLGDYLFPQHYEVGMRVMQRATAHEPGARFPSIDAFTKALIESLPARRSIPAPGRTFPPRANTFSGPLRLPKEKEGGQNPEGVLPSLQGQRAAGGATLSERIKSLERLAGKSFTDHRYQEAIQAYQQALELDSGAATLWLALGDTFLANEQFSEALEAYRKSIDLNSEDAEAWTNCGTVLELLGRRREAQACYERASQLRGEEAVQ